MKKKNYRNTCTRNIYAFTTHEKKCKLEYYFLKKRTNTFFVVPPHTTMPECLKIRIEFQYLFFFAFWKK